MISPIDIFNSYELDIIGYIDDNTEVNNIKEKTINNDIHPLEDNIAEDILENECLDNEIQDYNDNDNKF
jgi:hypothetical protein